jgi:hypothetical protein
MRKDSGDRDSKRSESQDSYKKIIAPLHEASFQREMHVLDNFENFTLRPAQREYVELKI